MRKKEESSDKEILDQTKDLWLQMDGIPVNGPGLL